MKFTSALRKEKKEKTGKAPGIVVVQFPTEGQRNTVLKAKMKLAHVSKFKNVFIEPYKTLSERRTVLNNKAILYAIGKHKQYKVTQAGFIVKQDH